MRLRLRKRLRYPLDHPAALLLRKWKQLLLLIVPSAGKGMPRTCKCSDLQEGASSSFFIKGARRTPLYRFRLRPVPFPVSRTSRAFSFSPCLYPVLCRFAQSSSISYTAFPSIIRRLDIASSRIPRFFLFLLSYEKRGENVLALPPFSYFPLSLHRFSQKKRTGLMCHA